MHFRFIQLDDWLDVETLSEREDFRMTSSFCFKKPVWAEMPFIETRKSGGGRSL